MKRLFGASLALLVTLAFAHPAVAAQNITITVASLQPFQAAPYVAVDKGYFADEGLDVTLLPAGGGTAIPALMSGTVEASGSAASALSAILRGAPLRVVYVTADNPPYRVWAAPGIRSLADLKGKLVGVVSRGDTYEIGMRIALQDLGMSPDAVGYTPLGSITNMGAALDTGALSAIVLSTGESAGLKAHGLLKNARAIADFHGKVHMPFAGLAMSEKVLYGDPVLAKKILLALVKAGRYVKAYKNETVAILVKYQKAAADPEGTATEYDDLTHASTNDFTMSNEAVLPDLQVRAGIINLDKDKIPPVDKIYDFSIVRAVNAELNAAHWKPAR